MFVEGTLRKMEVRYEKPIDYQLLAGDTKIPLNGLLGKPLSITYQGKINCIHCGAQTKTSFFQGYCYSCFTTLPETDECVLQPEKCLAHEGISRDMAWSQEHCLTAHYVYLALSSDIKVGVTRHTQVPTRWIDQGASQAIVLARTPNRHTAGLIEVALKKHMSDKTNWQKMLKNQIAAHIDLVAEKNRAASLLPPELATFVSSESEISRIDYPALSFPTKVVSMSFDKTPQIRGTLTAIKGQYLIFDNVNVINIRKHGGYRVRIEY